MVALPACAPEPHQSAFRATGETLAFSGGDAGAQSACVSCHGLSGEGDGRLAPRLAGLDAGYLHRQMDDYTTGRREHAVMRRIMRDLDGSDRSKVAAYYAGLAMPQPKSPPTPVQRNAERLYRHGDPSRGIPSCASCHGASGEGRGPANPPLAGQPADYILKQLVAWRNGKRHNDPLQEMQTISKALRPDELRPIAYYSAQLAGHQPQHPAASP